jgi:hypothetical protein
LFIEDVNLFVTRIHDGWPIPDMIMHFLPQLVTIVSGLLFIGASPARAMSSSANEVLIILTQLGMVYSAVEVDGVLTTATVAAWVLPELTDTLTNNTFARMTSSFARLDTLLRPAVARARAQQEGAGGGGAVQDPSFADFDALRQGPPGMGDDFPAPSNLPPVGGGATASGTGYSQQSYVLCFLLYLDYSIIGSRITYKASWQIRAVFIDSPLAIPPRSFPPLLVGFPPPFSCKRILGLLGALLPFCVPLIVAVPRSHKTGSCDLPA